MEFKVGDTVRILDRVGDEDSYFPIYTDYMLKYAGTLAIICNITSGGSLELCNNEFYWDKKAVKLVNSANLTSETSIGTVAVSKECLINDCIGTNIAVYSHRENYNTFCDGTEEKPKEEKLNLFPTKKHYQLNFNY